MEFLLNDKVLISISAFAGGFVAHRLNERKVMERLRGLVAPLYQWTHQASAIVGLKAPELPDGIDRQQADLSRGGI